MYLRNVQNRSGHGFHCSDSVEMPLAPVVVTPFGCDHLFVVAVLNRTIVVWKLILTHTMALDSIFLSSTSVAMIRFLAISLRRRLLLDGLFYGFITGR